MKHLMELIKDTGHFADGRKDVPRTDYHRWHEIVFTANRFSGLAVHSLISGRPRDIYLTDGRTIFYEKGATGKKPFTDSQKEDIIREDLVFQIIDGRPAEIDKIYESVDGHLRIADFNSSFAHILFSSYMNILEKISKEVPAGLIREDEHKHIHRRVLRNRDHIARLLAAMKADGYPYHDFAATVEKRLREFGY